MNISKSCDSKTIADGPAFLGIGAQRAGTSWVHSMLSMNPEIWLPPIKELHFFDMYLPDGSKAAKYGEHLDGRFRSYARILLNRQISSIQQARELGNIVKFDLLSGIGFPSIKRYKGLFAGASKSGNCPGEITPAYATLTTDQVRYVRQVLGPYLRVFYIIRDPMERMWSHLTKDRRKAKFYCRRDNSFEYQIRFLNSEGFRLRTSYASTIENWRSVFGSENFKLLFFDDIAKNGKELVYEIEKFIGVNHNSSDVVLPPQNSYKNSGEKIPKQLLCELARISLIECKNLKEYTDNEYVDIWIERASQALVDERCV